MAQDIAYNPFGSEELHNPFHFYEDARANYPVFWSKELTERNGKNTWLIFGFNDIWKLLTDPRVSN